MLKERERRVEGGGTFKKFITVSMPNDYFLNIDVICGKYLQMGIVKFCL